MKKLTRKEYAHEVALVAAAMQDLVGAALYKRVGSQIGGIECWAKIAYWAQEFVDKEWQTEWCDVNDNGRKGLSKKYKKGGAGCWDEVVEDYALHKLENI